MLGDYSNDYLRLDVLAGTPPIIRVTRLERRFEDVQALRQAWNEMLRALDGIDRRRHNLLVDTRMVPGRNDSEFEAAFAPLRRELTRGFPKTAVLVQAVIGRLQAQRHIGADGGTSRAFQSEQQALNWLRAVD
ncbi:MAG: hypothetical protein R3B13_06580 [Polyangiaceae bacterium]